MQTREGGRERGTQDSFAEVTALWGRVILPISYQKFSPERSLSEFPREKRELLSEGALLQLRDNVSWRFKFDDATCVDKRTFVNKLLDEIVRNILNN